MTKRCEEIIKEHFNDKFGGLVSDMLFRQRLSKFSVSNFEKLSNQRKIQIGQMMLEDIFKEFYPVEKIESMKILFLLRFSLNEAMIKVEEMLSQPCDIFIESTVEMNASNVETFMKSDDSKIKFVFEWLSMIEGSLLVMLEKETVVKLANAFISASMGMPAKSEELDDMKISSLNEFFNIILPAFSSVIGNAFGQQIMFMPLSFDEFRSKYFFESQFIKPEKTILTKIKLRIGDIKDSGEVLFIIKQSSGKFSELLSQAHLEKDPLEMTPPKIIVKPTGNYQKDVEEFFAYIGLPHSTIDYLLRQCDKQTLANFGYLSFTKFYLALIDEYFPTSSRNKKENIKINLARILGLKP